MQPGFDSTSMALNGGLDLSVFQIALYAFIILFGGVSFATLMAVFSLPVFFLAILLMQLGFRLTDELPDPIGKLSKMAGLVFRSLRRNTIRTALTYVALFVLTFILTAMYSFVRSLGELTSNKEGDQLVIMTERFSIPSMMPPSHAVTLRGMIEEMPANLRPKNLDDNFMTWSFVGATTDPNKATPENSMFLFCLDPKAVTNGMMKEQGLNPEDLGEENWKLVLEAVEMVKQDRGNIIVGADRLMKMDKKVGDRIKLYSTNYKELEFDCTIVGAFPSGSRMAMSAAMRYDYLESKLDQYKSEKGNPHPNANRAVNLVWIRMPSKESYEYLAEQVNNDKSFSPSVKLETFSAVIGAFLDPFKSIIWGMKWILMPSIVVIMCVVIGITITISVRERWAEMAVLKVLGFQPWQVMTMVISEAMLIGLFGGMLSTWLVFFLPKILKTITKLTGTRIAFFDSLSPYEIVLLYGPLLGLFVGWIGSVIPSWSARKIKVSEVFAQVA